jgi:hypothetical protein
MYIGNDLRSGRSEVFYYTASGGESSITTASDSRALLYTVGWCAVYLNGVRLHEDDFTATTGNSITGLSALSADDVVLIEAMHTFSSSDSVPATGGTFGGAVIHSGAVTNSSTTVATGLITANGGLETDTNSKIKQKGAFMQSSTHQALTLGY